MFVTLQFEVPQAKLVEALEATKPFAIGKVKVFQAAALPKLPSDKVAFESRARAIALAVQPRSSQSIRHEALDLVLRGGDTWFDQKGVPNSALRAATGALSRALRKFAPHEESPLEILARRIRETVPDGPYKGQYQGTRYQPTNLGKRVREILVEMGAIRRER